MAGPNAIQRYPIGLLSLLDTKSLGKNPPTFPPMLSLVADVRDMYLPPPEIIVSTTGTETTVGPKGVITVPDGEAWVVRSVGAFAQATVTGGALSSSFLVALGTASGVAAALNDRMNGSFAVGEPVRWGFTLPQYMIATAGSTFSLQIEVITGSWLFSNTVFMHRLDT